MYQEWRDMLTWLGKQDNVSEWRDMLTWLGKQDNVSEWRDMLTWLWGNRIMYQSGETCLPG